MLDLYYIFNHTYLIYKYAKKIGVYILIFIILVISFLFSSTSSTEIDNKIVNKLQGYIEKGFFNSFIPDKSPLGGTGLSYTQITANYHDPEYYKEFGFEHNGIDLIPSSLYYKDNDAYLKTGKIIIFSTISGIACSSGNIQKGYRVEVTNKWYKAVFLHQQINTILIGECRQILSGEPIGIMGQTGFATGIHVHYMVLKNVDNVWIEQNPFNYISK